MTLDELRKKHRDDILRITGEYGIENVRVFGSIVRGEADDDSDLDLLVTLGRTLGLDFVGCKLDLEDKLQMPVDLVSDDALDKFIGPYILKEAARL